MCVSLQALAASEESKRRALLELVYSLENDKRQLETALVVEGQRGPSPGAAAGPSSYAKALALAGGEGRRSVALPHRSVGCCISAAASLI